MSPMTTMIEMSIAVTLEPLPPLSSSPLQLTLKYSVNGLVPWTAIVPGVQDVGLATVCVVDM